MISCGMKNHKTVQGHMNGFGMGGGGGGGGGGGCNTLTFQKD